MARILVVDDNASNRKLVVTLLGLEGHQMIEASDGVDGLEAARALRPDLVISDILMPSMDGFEFVRLLRADPKLHNVAAIFYTAHYHEAEARNLARACQVSRVIVRSSGAAGIVAAVAEVLSGQEDRPPQWVDPTFDREHLELITNKLAQKANLLKVANARFAALTDLNVQLASEREPRVLFEKVCRGARSLLGAKYSVLAVAGDSGTVISSSSGVDLAQDDDAEPRIEGGLLGRVALERRPWRAASGNGSPIDAGLPARYPAARAFLAAPVMSLTQTFGWLCLADKVGAEEFTAEDELILSVLGAQSGRIYENGRLYFEVQHHAAQLQVEIDERARAAAELRVSEERFRELAENIQDAFFVVAGDLSYTMYMSPAYAQIWGRPWTDGASAPVPWSDSIHAQDVARLRQELEQDSRGMSEQRELEFRITRPDGEIRWICARTFPIVQEPGGIIGRVVGVATDITQRKQAEAKIEHLNRVHAMLSGINSLIVRVADRTELFWEACRIAVEYGRFRMAWCSWLDPETSQVTPVAWAGDDPDLAQAMACKLDGGDSLIPAAMRLQQPVICDDLLSDSRLVPPARQMIERGYHAIVALPLVIDAESAGCLVLVMDASGFFNAAEMRLLTELSSDIAFALDHIKKAERLNYLAYYDSLTGLANRTFFYERLAQYASAAARAQRRFALVVADLERFETVNDTFGRHAGDELLRQLGARLAGCVGDASEVARLGADQFAAVIFDVGEVTEVAQTIEKWRHQWLGAPFMVEGTELRMSVKTAVAVYPGDGTDPVTLIRNAEAALKNAKSTGERLSFYAPYLTDRANEALALESQLKRAIEQEEFVLYYQPKVDLETRRLQGVEALIRWQHPQSGLIAPMKFIPLLEETGMIVEVGNWALRQAILDRGLWMARHLNAPRIAVNVSTVQLQRSDFVRSVSNVLKLSGGDPGIDIEVTESLIMSDASGNIEKLSAIRDLGVRIAIDDFGTGYSSLAYLTKLPAQALKIDRSFVISMLEDPGAMTLVSTIISLAHSLKLVVVAEGVESEEQAKFLRLLRCDQMQGYLISKPVSVEEMTTYLGRHRGEPEPLRRTS